MCQLINDIYFKAMKLSPQKKVQISPIEISLLL